MTERIQSIQWRGHTLERVRETRDPRTRMQFDGEFTRGMKTACFSVWRVRNGWRADFGIDTYVEDRGKTAQAALDAAAALYLAHERTLHRTRIQLLEKCLENSPP